MLSYEQPCIRVLSVPINNVPYDVLVNELSV